jgi:hypothetical protein
VTAWGGEPAQRRLGQEMAAGPRLARVTKVESFEISDGLDDVNGFHIID